jgi:CxxC motif-containing protein (DUF1111 family)
MRSVHVSVAILSTALLTPYQTFEAQGPSSVQGQSSSTSFGASDPGPRVGSSAAGGALQGLSSGEQSAFTDAMSVFMETTSVTGRVAGEEGSGLGPTFNGNSCAQCHAQPSVGGSSPGLSSPQNPVPNPQLALATSDGANNAVPSFITADGPVREARFVRRSDGSLDGGVHGLYTITGRVDSGGCTLSQPNFAQQLSNHNVIFRIPTPTFGLGLVEATTDNALRDNLASNQRFKSSLGIGGELNTTGNDGTVTRFGWKAQNKSLLLFAGEAYNVEQGVSNELFPNERDVAVNCPSNGSLEDITHMELTGTAAQVSSDLVGFSVFMRFLAAPQPAQTTTSTQNGASIFSSIGCALCHTTSLTTGKARYAALSNVTYHPYSDFALHHMGSGLSDGIRQGNAGPDEFRTAPLWGAGQRLFFLHDGRTTDLQQAIRAHASSGSEANAVISRYRTLSSSQVQDLLNFLRSL